MIFLHVAVFKVSPQAQDQVVDIPVVVQTQIPMVRFTIEILQLQYIDQVGRRLLCRSSKFVPSRGKQSRSPARFFWTVVACPLCATTSPWSMTFRSSSTVVNVPVIIQRRLYSGSAPDSVHRQSPWTDQLCNRAWYSTFSNGGFGGDEGFF